MARAGDTLHRRDRYHSHFHGTSWSVSLQHLQQIPRGSPQRPLRGILAPVKGGGYLGNPVRAFGVGLTWRHACDGTCQRAEPIPRLSL
jgi:hypothetical protein